MSTQQRSVTIKPKYAHQGNVDVTVFGGCEDGRLTVAIYTGVVSLYLKPTLAEARDLIATLQWAVDASEPVLEAA